MPPEPFTPAPARPAGALKWTAYLWLALCVGCSVRAFMFPTSHTVFHDYAHAGRAWLAGTDAYEIERDAQGVYIPRMSGFRYSPLVSIVLVPFGMLPIALGGAVWRLFSAACFLGGFAWFVREVVPGARHWEPARTAALWLLLIPLSLGSLNNGQANVLLMGLLMAAGAAVVTERWSLTACFLAGACLLKIYPVAIALLMLVVYPRQLGWRLLLALGIGLVLPFALQSPEYVLGQYHNWYDLVSTDNRRDYPMNHGYRDFYLLTRFIGAPMAPKLYLALQLTAAALTAGICLMGKLASWPKNHVILTLLGLGCCWMVVFGPSTESCTFILIAPALACAVLDAVHGSPMALRWLPVGVLALFLLTFMATWFPGGRDWFYILQPLSAALFFVDRLLQSRPKPEVAADVSWAVWSRAA